MREWQNLYAQMSIMVLEVGLKGEERTKKGWRPSNNKFDKLVQFRNRDYGMVVIMKEVVYKPNRLLIILLIDGLVIPIIMITLWIIFDVITFLLELTESVIIIISAHLVYKDAQRIKAGASYEQRLLEPDTWSPTSWGLVVLFFWIVMLPLYILMREGIFWKNQQPSMDDRKPVRHYIEPLKHKPPASKPVIYGKNVLFCLNCETPYSKKMLERSPYCKHCGELLKKE